MPCERLPKSANFYLFVYISIIASSCEIYIYLCFTLSIRASATSRDTMTRAVRRTMEKTCESETEDPGVECYLRARIVHDSERTSLFLYSVVHTALIENCVIGLSCYNDMQIKWWDFCCFFFVELTTIKTMCHIHVEAPMVTNWFPSFLYFLPTSLSFGSKRSMLLFSYLLPTITCFVLNRKTNWWAESRETN